MTLQLTAEQRVEALRRMTPEMREEFDRLLEGVDPRDVDGFGLWLPEVSPTWSWNWRHLLEVRKALMEVTRGTSRRLMIYQPPRHGKSEMTTIRYPVWRLEKWRDTKVCVGCYNQRFAERFGRKSRQLAEKRGVVSRNRRAAMEWETEKGGVYRSCGVGSPPTGEGFNLIIIDDPVKSREEAESESYRERAWEWYQDLYTRLEPNAAVILMMCMVGGTPVLMGDGTETPLRDVRPGDRVATYDAGQIGVANVVNWSSRGLDSTYEIRMKSGIMVRANERHPFLVFRSGDTRWVRLTDLMVGDEIVAVTRRKERGKGRYAATSAARPRLGQKGIACATTTSGVGKEGSGRRPTLPSLYGHPASNIATGSSVASMSECSPLKTDVVPSVENIQGQTCAPIGVGNSASITTPIREGSGVCCATTATSRLGTERRKNDCSEPLNTCGITRDRIESIAYYGVEEVFDVQIEGTENFIANGLVSHNTRWHEDDLAGRLLAEGLGGDEWKVVSMPALDDDGKALWPERFPRDVLEQYRRVLGEYAFEALYQQRPTAREGNLFKVDRIIEEKAPDEYTTRVRAWDLAATPGGGDWTAGVLLGRNASADRWCILDLVRGRWSADERNAIIRTTAVMDGMDTRVRFAQDPGQAGKEQAQGLVGMLGGYVAGSKNVTGNKVTRADPLAAQVNAGNVSMARGDWNRELREELRRFPNGKNDDCVDAASDAFAELASSAPWEFF